MQNIGHCLSNAFLKNSTTFFHKTYFLINYSLDIYHYPLCQKFKIRKILWLAWMMDICPHFLVLWPLWYPKVQFPGGTSGKEPAWKCRERKRCGFYPWVEENPWRRSWQPTPVFLPGESHGERTLVGCSPNGCRVGHDWSDLACAHMTFVISEVTVFYLQVFFFLL